MPEPSPDLAEVVAAAAQDLDPIAASRGTGAAAGATEYRRGQRLFAVVDGGSLEMALPADIAEAALRTPDTSAATRGPEWVRFAPKVSEPHVADRARAWFVTAWRQAGR